MELSLYDQARQMTVYRKTKDKTTVLTHTILGHSRFGKVYLGYSTKTQQVMAIKCIRRQDIEYQVQIEGTLGTHHIIRDRIIDTVKNQMTILNLVNKEGQNNLVKILGDECEKEAFFVMTEYCCYQNQQGHTLGYNLESVIPSVSLKEKVLYMLNIARGLLHLYNLGVMLRDLNTRHILVKNSRAKITGFTLAKTPNYKDQPYHHTFLVGWPCVSFTAIQLLEGDAYSIKCDVWSFGVIIFKMFFGVMPWEESSNIKEMSARIRKGLVIPESEVPSQTKELIRGCLQVNEDKRMTIKEVFALVFNISKRFNQLQEPEPFNQPP